MQRNDIFVAFACFMALHMRKIFSLAYVPFHVHLPWLCAFYDIVDIMILYYGRTGHTPYYCNVSPHPDKGAGLPRINP